MTMTVKDLIQKLWEYPEDSKVFITADGELKEPTEITQTDDEVYIQGEH